MLKEKLLEQRRLNQRKRSARFRQLHPDRVKKTFANWYKKNKEISNQKSKTYYKVNQKKLKELTKIWKQNNKDQVNTLNRAWKKQNKEAVNKVNTRRRALKRVHTPKWLSEWDIFLMQEIHDLCRLRSKYFGQKYHVDHIVPLKGDVVSGLNVPWNLQIIPAIENLKKSNRYACN